MARVARVAVAIGALVLLATGAAPGGSLAVTGASGDAIPGGVSTLFAAGEGPAQVQRHADLNDVELGVRLTVADDGQLRGLRFFRATGDRSEHQGSVWAASGRRLATLTFPASSTTGWQNAEFDAPLQVRAGARLTVSYHTRSGYSASTGWFDRPAAAAGDVTWTAGNRSGVYAYGRKPTRPATVHRATNYWVDALFEGSGETGRPAPPTSAAPTTTVPPTAAPTTTTAEPSTPTTTTTAPPTTAVPTTTVPPSTAPPTVAVGARAVPGAVGFRGDRSTLRVIDSSSSAPAGTTWSNGTLVVNRSGVVLDGVWVKGSIDFHIPGSLVVRNSVVEANGRFWSVIGAADQNSTLEVTDSTVVWPTGVQPPGANWGNGAIHGDARMTIVRTDISGTPDGIQQGSGNSTFQQNWIHDVAKLPGTHNDGIQLYGGPGVVVVGNYIELTGYHGTENAAVFLSDDGSGFTAPVIANNYLSGGGFQLRLETGVSGATVTGNDFGPLAGGWGEILVNEAGAISTWSANRSSNGSALSRP